MTEIHKWKSDDILLYNDDCLNIFPLIDDRSIDMIFCDLPYSITACKWDIPIPLDILWGHYERVIKDDGVIVLTASQPFTSVLVSSNLKLFRYEWIWEKSQGTNPLNAKYMPLKKHESILIFYKKRGVYNPQMTIGKPYSGFSSNTKNIGEVYGDNKSIHKENKGTRYPTTIQHFKHDTKKIHPTQKPVKLVEYFILTYSNEDDIVLDNCSGSGTTAIACINTKRKCIAIEKEVKYFNKSVERISNNINEFFD